MLSVIIPAHNEEAWIGPCLENLLADPAPPGGAEVVVAANGCKDKTVTRAQVFEERARAQGWGFVLLDLPGLGKPAALNSGDAAASGEMRLYLDADVKTGRGVIAGIVRALDTTEPRYASARPVVARAQSAVTRAYASFWKDLPFTKSPAPGFGLFAVNAAGRARWGEYPKLISDDTYVRLLFTPEERVEVPGTYEWPMVEGFDALVRVRRRQDAGVKEIAALHPELLANEGKPPLGKGELLGMALRNPVGFATYAAVSLAVRGKASDGTWSRGR
ncbi:glycosyltransferase [Paenirhodobacter populi]|uniref:glycosyltransferase n=1 Tax=Paenirhodobacter populi TaxID=2306993 RepID=UPI001F4D9042|nr:glycosyltransferase [Sinirhodobacter populi]